ncbi:zinc finger, CCHC-type containing protein [Tanacetum coccineum]
MSTLARLEDIPKTEIMDKLKISCDGLKPVEKDLFLDISCFFRGKTKDYAIEIHDACGFHPRIGITVLIQKALITISNGKFDMHDLVKQMGQYIIRGEHPNNPEKHSRVWLSEDIEDMCSRDVIMETDNVKAIECFDHDCSSRFYKLVLNMKKLRLLSVRITDNEDIEEPTFLSNELRLQKELWKVSDDSDSVYMSSSTVVNSSLWHARLGHVHYKRMLEMSKDELIPAIDENPDKCTTCMLTKITRQPFKSITRKSVILELIHSDLCDFHATPSLGNKKYVITFIDDASRFCYVYLLHAKDEALDKFRIYKTEVELQQNDLIKTLRTDRGGEYYDPVFFQSVGIIHETTAPYTPQQNGVAERKNRALKEMVNSMVPNKRNKTTPYELWYKKRPNLSFLRHSKAYRFYVIEPNDYVFINPIIESRDAIFDENRFSSIPRPKDIIPNSVKSQRDDHSDDVPSKTHEPRKGKRVRKAKSHGYDFQLYLVEGSRDQVGSQYSYCYSIEEDPRTYNEVMQSFDAAFWKEAIDDEIGSIMENNTWVLSDLPPGCKPLGCKWIFKRKMKFDGTIDKFKARLVIQGFRQKEGIDYFHTYAPVTRITTIRLLLDLAAIHNLVIHQMDVKTSFLNGDLDEEVYMKQPEGFVTPGNEHKVCKLVKSLYGLKQTPKQWHQKFDEVMLLSGFLLNQSNKCVYSKFDSSGKGVIICLYVDDMLIFGTDQNQVDKTKKFLSSKFSMKDMGEADVILGIKIKRKNKGIVITQSHYIEKILKKFNREDCSPVSTSMDLVEKIKPNTGKPVDQLEYLRAIGCLIYAMTSTRPDIPYAVGRLSRFTNNPNIQHWHAITRVFKYLKGTMNYGLSYVRYPSVLEAYSDASWINHVEDSSSTSGWMFLLGGHIMGF